MIPSLTAHLIQPAWSAEYRPVAHQLRLRIIDSRTYRHCRIRFSGRGRTVMLVSPVFPRCATSRGCNCNRLPALSGVLQSPPACCVADEFGVQPPAPSLTSGHYDCTEHSMPVFISPGQGSGNETIGGGMGMNVGRRHFDQVCPLRLSYSHGRPRIHSNCHLTAVEGRSRRRGPASRRGRQRINGGFQCAGTFENPPEWRQGGCWPPSCFSGGAAGRWTDHCRTEVASSLADLGLTVDPLAQEALSVGAVGSGLRDTCPAGDYGSVSPMTVRFLHFFPSITRQALSKKSPSTYPRRGASGDGVAGQLLPTRWASNADGAVCGITCNQPPR